MLRTFAALAASLSLVASAAGPGGQPDPGSLYELKTEATPASVKAGDQAQLRIAIVAKDGAYVSDEAPLKIELSGKNATPAKTKLTLADSVEKKVDGQKPNARFEAAFTTSAPGAATLDAKMTFFICTKDLCARQVKQISVPVEVTAITKAL